MAFDKDKNAKKINDIESINSKHSDEFLKCTDRRKKWLSNYDKNSYIEVKELKTSYEDFINKELIHFSVYDNARSIPSLCDGLKPSQRKILHYMLKKNITEEIKVAQLSGYVSAETSYHHGEASLQGAIIGMAQDFTGTNNINLLCPEGQFGNLESKTAGSARYIFTRLSNITSYIFNKLDLPLLDYLQDDGNSIEPEYFLPIIPMILVNGCAGIGTGFSTYIPCYNPKDIIINLLGILNDDEFEPMPMKPYFKDFEGNIQEDTTKKGSYITKGNWKKLSDTQIKIINLPMNTFIDPYKEFIENLIENVSSKKEKDTKVKKTKKVVLQDIKLDKKNNTFIVEFKNSKDLDLLIKNNLLEKELKLVNTFSTNNMHLFDENLKLKKYNNECDVLLDFYDIRLTYYQKRKDYHIQKLENEYINLDAKMRFIQEYIDGKLDINRKSESAIVLILKKNGYPTMEDDLNYNYLTSLPIKSLSLEKIEDLNKKLMNVKESLDFYKTHTKEELWKLDLEDLLEKLN